MAEVYEADQHGGDVDVLAVVLVQAGQHGGHGADSKGEVGVCLVQVLGAQGRVLLRQVEGGEREDEMQDGGEGEAPLWDVDVPDVFAVLAVCDCTGGGGDVVMEEVQVC